VRRAGSFDYPVVLNLLGGYRFANRWDVSVRTAYLTGRPYTPFNPAFSVQQRRGIYDLSRVNDSRTPDHFRADVRVDRTFRVNGQPVTLFFGVQNVTNRTNIAGFTWDRRNNQPRASEQQGVFLVLGLDWRFDGQPAHRGARQGQSVVPSPRGESATVSCTYSPGGNASGLSAVRTRLRVAISMTPPLGMASRALIARPLPHHQGDGRTIATPRSRIRRHRRPPNHPRVLINCAQSIPLPTVMRVCSPSR
jgi:hypothetical protein